MLADFGNDRELDMSLSLFDVFWPERWILVINGARELKSSESSGCYCRQSFFAVPVLQEGKMVFILRKMFFFSHRFFDTFIHEHQKKPFLRTSTALPYGPAKYEVFGFTLVYSVENVQLWSLLSTASALRGPFFGPHRAGGLLETTPQSAKVLF